MQHFSPNLVPVANKYLAHKQFLKAKEDHKKNIKNAHGLLDQSAPTPRPHCTERIRQKQIKEHELEMIEHENERLRVRMLQNGAFVNSHNNYTLHSLNVGKRHRDEEQHRNEVERLQKQINHTRTSYPTRVYENDFAKSQDFKQRISKFPRNNK